MLPHHAHSRHCPVHHQRHGSNRSQMARPPLQIDSTAYLGAVRVNVGEGGIQRGCTHQRSNSTEGIAHKPAPAGRSTRLCRAQTGYARSLQVWYSIWNRSPIQESAVPDWP